MYKINIISIFIAKVIKFEFLYILKDVIVVLTCTMNIANLLGLYFLAKSELFKALFEKLHVEKDPSSFKAFVDSDTNQKPTQRFYKREPNPVPNVLQHMGPRCQAIIGLDAWQTLMSLFNQAHNLHPYSNVIDFNVFVVEYINSLTQNGRCFWPEQDDDDESDVDHERYVKWLLLEENIKFFLNLLSACEYGMREVALREETYATFTGLPHIQFTLPHDEPIEFTRPFDYDCVASFIEFKRCVNLPATIITEDKFDTLVTVVLCMAALPDETWDNLYRKPYDPTWKESAEYQFLYNAFDAVYNVCSELFDGDVYSNEGLSKSLFFEQ